MLSEGHGALQEENNSGSESRGAKGGTPTCCAPAVFQNKLAGTVWTDIDDARVFKVLDLEDLERTFSAYQRQQVTAGRGPAQASGADAVAVRSFGSTCGLRSCLLPLFHSVCQIDSIWFVLSFACRCLCLEMVARSQTRPISPLPTYLTACVAAPAPRWITKLTKMTGNA